VLIGFFRIMLRVGGIRLQVFVLYLEIEVIMHNPPATPFY